MREENLRSVIHIDALLKSDILSLEDAKYYSFSELSRKLIKEAIKHRKGESITPAMIENSFYSWNNTDVLNHLQNIVAFLLLKQEKPVDSDIGDVAIHFIQSLFLEDEPNNEDIAILAHSLQIDVVKFTKLRNFILRYGSIGVFE